MTKKTKIWGSIPPIITPFRDDRIDEDAFAALIRRQLDDGSHGVLINGTTAEPSTLTVAERNRQVQTAVDVVRSSERYADKFIVAATGSQSLAETRELTDYAAQAGVDALLIVTPYYIRPSQRGLLAYYKEVTSALSIPWMIYHIPGRAAVNVTLPTMQALAADDANFIGMKHAVNDLGFVSECLAAFGEDFRIFVGLEELSFPMMAVGAAGLMNAVGNLLPRRLAEMCELVAANDLLGARKAHQELLEINQAVFFDTNPVPIKYMMKKLGLIPDNTHRLPMVAADEALQKRLDAVLQRTGLLGE